MAMKTITYDETQWTLVPVEPTEKMVEFAIYKRADLSDFRHGHKPAPYGETREQYRAMLAAAPTPPAASADDARDAARYRTAVSNWNVLRVEVVPGVVLSHANGIPWEDLQTNIDALRATKEQA